MKEKIISAVAVVASFLCWSNFTLRRQTAPTILIQRTNELAGAGNNVKSISLIRWQSIPPGVFSGHDCPVSFWTV